MVYKVGPTSLTLFVILSFLFVFSFKGGLIHTSAQIETRLFDNSNIKKFNFVAAGDWSCDKISQKIVSNIEDIEPEIVLGLGDYVLKTNTNCWFDMTQPILSKMKIVVGNHDVSPSSKLNKYKTYFDLSKFYYSFDYGGVHFIAMSSEHPFTEGSQQYKFVLNDLKKSSSSPETNWIVVFIHQPLYSTADFGLEEADDLRDTYHKIFDKYDVDIVLNGHTQYYQRTYPINYNDDNPGKPEIESLETSNYFDPSGPIFITSGTGGDLLHNIERYPNYFAFQKEVYGCVDISIDNVNNILTGEFYDENEKVLDRFVIQK